MKRARILNLHFALAALFLATLACRSYDRIDPDILESDDLSGQNFSFKQLAGHDLSNKDLRNADFTGANLEGANLSNSDLTGVIFKRTVLVGANFTNAELDERWIPIVDLLVTRNGVGQNFQGVDLSNTYLPAANLVGADLREANLSGASLQNADLSDANLTDANLQGTALQFAILHNANLTDAKFNQHTNLFKASLVGATVSQRQLRAVTIWLSCTRLPDGSVYRERDCQGILPP